MFSFVNLAVALRKLLRGVLHRLHSTRPIEFGLVIRWLTLGPQDRICDIGCGDGYWTSRLADANRRVFGVDFDPKVIARARSYYGQFADFVLASAESLPFNNNTMDKVVSVCAMQHFTDDGRALREMYRILRPKGKLCLSLDSLSLPSIPTDFKARHAHWYAVNRLYTHTSIKPLFEQTGFRLLTYRYVATSRISSWLIQSQMEKRWNLNYLAPVTLPISRLADAISGKTDAGFIVVIAAEKKE